MFKDSEFKYNQTVLKVYGYGDSLKIKVITFKALRTSGLDFPENYFDQPVAVASLPSSVNAQKSDCNISRAKSKIFELAFCNPWDYFFTGTLNPKKYDRSDLEKFHKDLTQWFRDTGKRLHCKIDFLLIPELHSDGKSWHIHGFIHGLPSSELCRFSLGDKMGKALSAKVLAGDVVYNWPAYCSKFGFCDLEPIRNFEAVSKYITKYISKGLYTSVKDVGAHLYYHSRGLSFSRLIKKGTMSANIVPITYSNDYCSVSWVDYSEKLLSDLSSVIL